LTKKRDFPLNYLDHPQPDALFDGRENVIEGIFEKLRKASSGLVAKAG
jgi:hypothetical protein